MAEFWIYLVNVSQGSEYGKLMNMQGITQGVEFAWISLSMTYWCINMRGYVSITLNIVEYAGIYLKKQSAEYARILNESDAVYSIWPLYKLLSSILTHVFRTLPNI